MHITPSFRTSFIGHLFIISNLVNILCLLTCSLLNIVGKLLLQANSLRNSLHVFLSHEGTISTQIFVIFAVSFTTIHESYLWQGQLVLIIFLFITLQQKWKWLFWKNMTWINESNLASETSLLDGFYGLQLWSMEWLTKAQFSQVCLMGNCCTGGWWPRVEQFCVSARCSPPFTAAVDAMGCDFWEGELRSLIP